MTTPTRVGRSQPVCWLCGNRHNLHPVQYYTGGLGYSWSQECRDQAACEARRGKVA